MRAALVAAVLIDATAGSVCAAAGRPLALTQFLDWQQVSAPQIAPDATAIVYTRTRVDAQADRMESSLWIMDANGERNRYYADGREARWAPDSRRLAYLRQDRQGPRIVVGWPASGLPAAAVTPAELRPSGLAWSPDGKWIAFRAPVAARADWTISLPARPPGAKWAEDATVIDSLHYRSDGQGLRASSQHLFVVAAEGGEPRQLTQGNWNVGSYFSGKDLGDALEWTPDGKEILFTAEQGEDDGAQIRRSTLHAVDVGTGAIRQVVRSPGFWAGARVSPNGRMIAFQGMRPSADSQPARELHVAAIDGSGDITLIADLSGDLTRLEWDAKSAGIYYVVEASGSSNVHYAGIAGARRQITTGAHVVTVSSVSRSGIAAAVIAEARQPDDVFRFKLSTGADKRRLTSVNAALLRDVELGEVEEINYTSSEDARVQGWIIKPPGFDPTRKYPLLLYPHGGPHQMFNVGFFFRFQEFAARGYLVLLINPRGSTGYRAVFANAIDKAFPGRRDADDLMHGVDAVIARGYVDVERLYVAGCSGGGALANWLVTQTQRFAAAVSSCSISNWISFAGTTDITAWGQQRFAPAFWDDPKAWLAHSPLIYADQVTTPTLLMTGAQDLRTPLSQAEEFYSALKMHEVPTKLVIINDQPHGTSARPSNWLRSQLYMHAWMSQWRRVTHADGTSSVVARAD